MVLFDADTVWKGHGVHAAEPMADLNWPDAHGKHTPVLGPEKPALHKQWSRVAPGAGDRELTGQLAHTSGPPPMWKVSTPHSVHVSPFAPE